MPFISPRSLTYIVCRSFGVAGLFWLIAAMPVEGAEIDFMGSAVQSAPGQYISGADANVRAKPDNNGKKVGRLDEGDIVDVAGKAVGTAWYAVRKDGTPFGFVYETLLTPVIDGQIDKDATGELQVQADIRCGYRIHFIGKTEGDDQTIRTADYDATVVCERGKKRIRFPAQMFMTEVPFDRAKKSRKFQINIDLIDGLHGLIDIFSTTMMFDFEAGQVVYDQMSEKTYERENAGVSAIPATNITRALSAAIELGLKHWSDKAWDDIFEANG